jgi:hypothetical protein
MAKQNKAVPQPGSIPPAIAPDRHHGGLEPPDEVQDRPEQNAGYDAVVRGLAEAPATDTVDDMGVDSIGDGQTGVDRLETEPVDPDQVRNADARAERDAVAEVRRRERRGG